MLPLWDWASAVPSRLWASQRQDRSSSWVRTKFGLGAPVCIQSSWCWFTVVAAVTSLSDCLALPVRRRLGRNPGQKEIWCASQSSSLLAQWCECEVVISQPKGLSCVHRHRYASWVTFDQVLSESQSRHGKNTVVVFSLFWRFQLLALTLTLALCGDSLSLTQSHCSFEIKLLSQTLLEGKSSYFTISYLIQSDIVDFSCSPDLPGKPQALLRSEVEWTF